MQFQKIGARNTIVPQVYEQLKRAILRGTLKPGTRLVDTRVAEEFGVSRTPVREALSRLLAQGFVREEGTSKVVADMASELKEIFGVRQVLEGYAARLAAENATDAELDEIHGVCHASIAAVESTSVAERAALNNIFHSAVARASHNGRLIKVIGDFYEYAITEEMLPFYSRGDSASHVGQHLDILVGLRARDGDAAERAMRKHIGDVGHVIDEAIRRIREGTAEPLAETTSDVDQIAALERAQQAVLARLSSTSI